MAEACRSGATRLKLRRSTACSVRSDFAEYLHTTSDPFLKQRRFLDRADLAQQPARVAHRVRPSRRHGVPRRRGWRRSGRGCGRCGSRPRTWRCGFRCGHIRRAWSCTMASGLDAARRHRLATHVVSLSRARVRIVAGRFRADHARQFAAGDGSILPKHRGPAWRAVSSISPLGDTSSASPSSIAATECLRLRRVGAGVQVRTASGGERS